MFGLFTNQMRVNNLNLQTYLFIEASKKGPPPPPLKHTFQKDYRP
jgi:hypothetical protein